ncbi:glycosyltransferase family 4 protein [Pseudomonas sp. 10C3]|uniref:MraY family glycosyltransferase n=1 Tax=Pseudomonas sp. 10C3 TaxID=3118753 RepID=UPI002E80B20B|nr:glycosyltransferase family 4 protein [Pseudomonas sp. 10C3]MEE3508674.1 glycosyltransferase family 4 protein [Pseudomonas sp. 10C3]
MIYWWLIPVVAFFSFMLTAILRRYALSRSLMDIPNSRSSHSIPTPRGGGVAIAVVFLIILPVLGWIRLAPWLTLIAIGGAGVVVAIIGFMDDRGHIAVRWRLLAHFSVAIWVLLWLGGLPVIKLFGVIIDLSWFGDILAAVYLVWMLNLYNFMDGIDGLASVEALCTCLGACLLYLLAGFPQLIWVPLLLAMAVFGFFCWNFPSARIFMGDAGSGFLGITLGAISLQAAWLSSQLLWSWLILLGVFVVDATFTLIRRLVQGEKIYEAHRSHAYQFAFRKVRGHLPVLLIVGAINLLWLLPIALSVTVFNVDGALGLVIAYAPLVALAAKLRAGETENGISAP